MKGWSDLRRSYVNRHVRRPVAGLFCLDTSKKASAFMMNQGRLFMKSLKPVVAAISFTVLLVTASALAKEKKVEKTDLPAAVQKTVDEQSKGASVRGYSKETEKGKIEYEVQLSVSGHSKDVSIDADGKVIEVEEEVALDTLPGAVQSGLKQKAGQGKIVKVESLTKHDKLVAYEAQVQRQGKRSEIQVGPDGQPLARPE
jgi:inner membrane protein involved in colicin E2 resistance